jgi:hypothetical protein
LSELGDVGLHVLDLVLLGLVALLLLLLLLLARLHELVVVAAVVGQPLLRVVHDVRADVVHEVLAVRDHEQDLVPLGQVVLQPHHRLHVWVESGK